MAKTIYLVDDDPLMVKLYTTLLTTHNFEVTAFQNPEEGLEATLKDKPDLLLLDLKMPVLDGFSFLEGLRIEMNNKQMPVIVLTNLSNPEDAERAKEQGIADFLVKSDTNPDQLIKRVNKVLK